MFEGRLSGIYITREAALPMQSMASIEARAGLGLVGDRYFSGDGTFPNRGPDNEVTLIEQEALAGLAQEYDIQLDPSESRRNLVTEGVPLNHLVGCEFSIGAVVFRGLRLCEPCKHLEGLTQPGVANGLKHRGGLRAQIVRGGTLHVGDAVRVVNATASA